MSKALNYFEDFLLSFLLSVVVSTSAFALLVGVIVGIKCSVKGINICAITAGIKKEKSQEKRKKHDEVELLGKAKIETIKILLFRALIDS